MSVHYNFAMSEDESRSLLNDRRPRNYSVNTVNSLQHDFYSTGEVPGVSIEGPEHEIPSTSRSGEEEEQRHTVCGEYFLGAVKGSERVRECTRQLDRVSNCYL